MDSITQGLLGAAIGEAGFRERLGGRAVAWSAFVAIAPDFDLVAAVGGEWASLIHHRGVSHSWVCQSLVAPLIGWLAWRTIGKREGHWAHWAHLTWWALVTHPALDLCTAYGTQLLAPITDQRFAIDAVSIIDPLYSLPLLVATIWARRGRDRRRSRRVAIGALVLTTLYLGFGYAQSRRAIAWAEEELAVDGFSAVEVRALPTFANVWVHRVIARDGRGGFRVTHTSLSNPRPLVWYAVRDDDDPLVAVARASERGRIFRWFAMGFAWSELEHTDDGFTVRMSDLRYGDMAAPTRALWGAEARFDLDGDLLEVRRWRGERDLDLGRTAAVLYDQLVP